MICPAKRPTGGLVGSITCSENRSTGDFATSSGGSITCLAKPSTAGFASASRGGSVKRPTVGLDTSIGDGDVATGDRSDCFRSSLDLGGLSIRCRAGGFRSRGGCRLVGVRPALS